jgi:hypothetical protein
MFGLICLNRSRIRRLVSGLIAGVVITGPALAMGGCGNWVTTEIVGALAVSRDNSGEPILHIAVCKGSVDQIEMYDITTENPPDEPQKPVSTWASRQEVTREGSLALNHPGQKWTVGGSGQNVQRFADVQFEGGSSKQDQAVSGVTVSWKKWSALKPGQAIGSNGITNLDGFRARMCSR